MIKFKAWSKTLNRWLQPECIVIDGTGRVFYMRGGILRMQASDSVVICCYTGLQDVNGQDIFEGDILQRATEQITVECSQGAWGGYLDRGVFISFLLPGYAADRFEIVGHVLEEGVQE